MAGSNQGGKRAPGSRERSYLHARVRAVPLQWRSVSNAIAARFQEGSGHDTSAVLYGIWRSQIGRPRDELTVIVAWPDGNGLVDEFADLVSGIDGITDHFATMMTATLRPTNHEPPRRQGNYAFRWFELPACHWDEFEELCASAWPGFEMAYDSQIIGLWRMVDDTQDSEAPIRSLLLTRRPNLAMWERSKIPQGTAESEVRRKLSRRYDLCTDTVVFTTTLLTAEDEGDEVRWT